MKSKRFSILPKTIFILFLVSILATELYGQSLYAPLNQDYYHLVDREETLNRTINPVLHSSFKPYRRTDVVAVMDSSKRARSKVDEFNGAYLRVDNWQYSEDDIAKSKQPLFKKFYRNQADFFHVNKKAFVLRASPIFYFSGGRDDRSGSTPFINTRGAVIQGAIDDKVSFYSSIEETQAVFPKYIKDYIYAHGAVPNEAFWKVFGDDGVDFFTARGYVAVQATRHIDVQFGYDKNFIGNGYRSLFLSDFSAPSTFLKIQTKIWRIQYTNLFTELTADAPWANTDGSLGTGEFPKKFMAAHHLSINLTDNFNIGLYEAIMFHRGGDQHSAFELNYLNPIIFYRSIEQHTGSPDNAVFGLDWKWNVFKGGQLYGQFLLDELSVSELRARSGWWANKYSIQAGGKYFDAFGVANLDLQGEFNLSRPFTYSHESMNTSFTHYNMPLAHPLGANFKEVVLSVKYQPIGRLFMSGKIILADYGRNPSGQNLGGDIFADYTNHFQEYDNEIGQGVGYQMRFVDITATYMLRHNLFLDLKHVYRDLTSDIAAQSSTTNFTSFSVRLNVAARDHSF